VSRIYATPGQVLLFSGSVGASFIMWSPGAIIAACGMTVYVELGTGIPRSGGGVYIYTAEVPGFVCVYRLYIDYGQTLQLRLFFMINGTATAHINTGESSMRVQSRHIPVCVVQTVYKRIRLFPPASLPKNFPTKIVWLLITVSHFKPTETNEAKYTRHRDAKKNNEFAKTILYAGPS